MKRKQSMRLKWKQQLMCTVVMASLLAGCGASGSTDTETSQTEGVTSEVTTETESEIISEKESQTEMESESADETEVVMTIADDAQEWIYNHNYYIRDDDGATMKLSIMNDVVLDVYCESNDGASVDYLFDIEPNDTGNSGELIYQDGEGTVLTYYSFEGLVYLSAADSSLDGYYLAGSSFTEEWYKEYGEFQNRSTKDTVVISYSDFGEGAEYLEFQVNDTGLVYCYADAYTEEPDGGFLYTSEIGGGTAEYYPDDGNYLVITFNGESTTYQNGILYENTDEAEDDNSGSSSDETTTYTMTDAEYNAVYSAVQSYSWTGSTVFYGLASIDSIEKVGEGSYHAHVKIYYDANSSLTLQMTVVVADYGLGGYKGTTHYSGWN